MRAPTRTHKNTPACIYSRIVPQWHTHCITYVLCPGCPETARQKILSILHHTSNNHNFPDFHFFKKCEHGDLGEERRPWIEPESLAMNKLRNAICGDNNRNLDDLKFMTGLYCFFCHYHINTGIHCFSL